MSDILQQDKDEDIRIFQDLFIKLAQISTRVREDTNDYVSECEAKGLFYNRQGVEYVLAQVDYVDKEIAKIYFYNLYSLREPAYSQKVTDLQNIYRNLLQIIGHTHTIIDWRASAYQQSVDAAFYHVKNLNSLGVNYARYESAVLEEREKWLGELLGISEQQDLLFTSSGMSAYTVIESYLLRDVLKSGDRVMIVGDLYYEIEEQLTELQHIDIHKQSIDAVETIVASVKELRPKVLFVDPLTNNVHLRAVHIKALLAALNTLDFSSELVVVVDNTMVTGVDVCNSKLSNTKVKTLYFASCNKYLQLGIDTSFGGILVIPQTLKRRFRRLRTNTGSIMYDNYLKTYPIFSRDTLLLRSKRIERNAHMFCEYLNKCDAAKKFVIRYPTERNHKDCKKTDSSLFYGTVVTVENKDSQRNNKSELDEIINRIMLRAEEEKISLTKGVGFGFSLPRVSIFYTYKPDERPFIRFSIGDRSYEEVCRLSAVVAYVLGTSP